MSSRTLIRNSIRQGKRMLLRLSKYHIKKPNQKKPGIYFILDEKHFQKHPGLMDRMKAIVGVYYIAQRNDMNFYLLHTAAFDLRRYLIPNEVQWACEKADISDSYFDTCVFQYDPYLEVPEFLDKEKQYHCFEYIGRNILELNSVFEWEKTWKECYDKLFKPSDFLKKMISENRPVEHFVGVHIRFVNALEKVEVANVNSTLNAQEKKQLISACVGAILEIQEKEKKPVVVFSDSKYFLQYIEQIGVLTLGTKNIAHISFTSSQDGFDRTFLDAYMLADADCIYTIQGKVLYASAFSKYAAIIGGKPYKVFNI